MNPAWFILSLAVLIGIVAIFYYSPSYAPKILVAAPGPYSLDKVTTIVEEAGSKPFYSDSNGTFSAFVYLNPVNRTGAYASCGTEPGQSSCEDGTFAPCPCDPRTGDCSSCNHPSYNSVFNISGIVGLEVMIAPDASRQGKAMAQLVVKTEDAPLNPGYGGSMANGGSMEGSPSVTSRISLMDRPTTTTGAQGQLPSQKYIETLSLPPLPVQGWTFVTVARDGRRFDVYYNSTLVLSQKTMSMPISNISNTSMNGITSGSSGLSGQLAVANLYNYRLSTKDVAAKYTQYADTRGRPYLNSVGNPVNLSDIGGIFPTYASTISSGFLSFIPSFNLCPGGCFNPPTIRPASPLYDWSTPYQ